MAGKSKNRNKKQEESEKTSLWGLVGSTNTDNSAGEATLGTYPEGSHLYVPDFDYDDEINGSKLTSQMEALYYLLKGDNVVLCGQAGAGKSWVIDTFKRIMEAYSARLESDGKSFTVATTASTGIAATLIFGKTIHSWSGLGVTVDKFVPSNLIGKQKAMWKAAAKRIKATDCLIIDEVSMLPAYFLSNLDRACKIARGKPSLPFGGLQIVLVGDFLQLPPVDSGQKDSNGQPVDSSYCFNALNDAGEPIFKESHFKYCYLDRSRRSAGDSRLNDLLNGIRNGDVSQKSLDDLSKRFIEPPAGKICTNLRTVNKAVDKFNDLELSKLPSDGELTIGVSKMGDDEIASEIIRNGKLKPVTLRIGAKVMLTSNRAVPDSNYVNGSMGIVEDIDPETLSVVIRFNDGVSAEVYRIDEKKTEPVIKIVTDPDTGRQTIEETEEVVAAARYLPVKLAWAITVHKSQGQTLDGAVIDLSHCFQKGLGYVALSRCRSLDDIFLKGKWSSFPEDALKIDPDAVKADKAIRHRAENGRKKFLENEARVADLMIARDNASSKTAAARINASIGDAVSVHEMLSDDEHCYQYVRDHRARKATVKAKKNSRTRKSSLWSQP